MADRVMTLGDFLLARIAEDEAEMVEARVHWMHGDHSFYLRDRWLQFNPDNMNVSVGYGRVLAECQSKRAILELLTDAQQSKRDAATEGHVWAGDQYIHALALVVERMAEVYADHPDRARVTSL